MAEREDVIDADEIYLSELLHTLWRKKFLIILTALVVTSAGFNYAYFQAETIYRATAIFNLKNPKNNAMNFEGLDSLAAFSGLSGLVNTKSKDILDEITGADFLRKIVTKLNLTNDKEFFSKPTKQVDSLFSNAKNLIKSVLKIKNDTQLLDSDVTEIAMRALKRNLLINTTKAGAYKIRASSNDPHKAALIANTVMKEFLLVKQEDRVQNSELSLSYLTKTLTKFKDDFDKSNDRLENFILENNVLSENELKIQTLRLNEFRSKIIELKDQINDLKDLNFYFQNTTVGTEDLKQQLNRLYSLSPRLRSFSITQNSNQSDFQFELDLAKKSISDEILRTTEALNATNVGYQTLVKKATTNSADIRTLTELKREAEMRGLFFETMIKQLGSSRVATGYIEDLGVVYETARRPLNAAEPNKKFILGIFSFVGLLIGCTVSILIEYISPKIWSLRLIETSLGKNNVLELRTRIYKIKNLQKLLPKYEKEKAFPSDKFKINKLLYRLKNSQKNSSKKAVTICVADFGEETLGRFSIVLASLIQENGQKVAFIDNTYKTPFQNFNKLNSDTKTKDIINNNSSFSKKLTYERLEPPRNTNQISEYQNTLQRLKSSLENENSFIFILVDKVESQSTSITQLFESKHLIVLTKTGQLKNNNLISIRSIQSENAHDIFSVLFFR